MDDDVHNANNLGSKFIMPSSFHGGPWDMQESLQNSLAITKKYGLADLFITMTTNPNWKEIKDVLLPGQTVQDRPDLVSRVFHLKKKHLLDLIVKDKILGGTIACVHTIEFQKRGLSHMHLLIWFDRDSKIRHPHEVDSMISAEFPDPETHPLLYKLVCDMMTHGPCHDQDPRAPCMKDGKCGKHSPKPFL